MLLIGTVLVTVTVLLGALIRHRLSPLDSWALRSAHVEPDTVLGQVATTVSGAAVLVCVATLVAVAVAVWRRHPARRTLLVKYSLLLVACVAMVFSQQLFQRPGPPVVAADWTYPSGHGTIAAAFAFTAILLATTMLPAWRTVVITVECVAVALTLASRVALGEHYVTDVVGAVIAVVGLGLVGAAVLKLRTPAAQS